VFVVEVTAVPAAAGSVEVAVSWQVPYRQLTFRREDDWYRARYDLTAVFEADGRQMGGDVWSRRIRLRSLEETLGAGEATGRRTLKLPARDCEVRVRMVDRVSHSSSEVKGKVRANYRRSQVALGDLRFVHYRDGAPARNPTHVLAQGESGHAVRFDLRPAAGLTGEVTISWRVRDPSRGTVSEGDTTLAVADLPPTFEFPLESERFTVGRHDLEVRLDGPGEESDRRTAHVTVRLSPNWFVARREEALEVFQIVAEGPEWDRLRNASEGEWARRVEEFWDRHDPSPRTAGNEYREEIQRRMEAAATMFVEPFRTPGWRTDRGRVMLRLGPPARRSHESGDFDRPPSELWEYDSPRRFFLFVDEQGTGEYWLRG